MDVLSANYGSTTRKVEFHSYTDFASITITEPSEPSGLGLPSEISLRVRLSIKDDLLFLDQLRAAVDEAIKWMRSR